MHVRHLALVAALLTVTAACSDSPTSPSTTTTTIPATTVAEPTVTEEFNGTVRVSGAAFYSYTVTENGAVRVTLSRVGGTNVPSGVWLGLGIGQPSGEECTTTLTVNGPSGSTAQLTGTYSPGVYCVRVWDLGNLIAPAQFAISIAHP